MVLAFVVGLRAEARLAGGHAFAGGGGADGAREAAQRAIEAGASALVSFGLAGGLSPVLRPGMLVTPRFILTRALTYPTDPDLSRALGGTASRAVLAASALAVTVREKAALWAETRAEIVDLESGAVAELAAKAGLPFAVLRAVCDPAWRSLPPAALLALKANGAIAPLRVAASVLRRPLQLPALLGLARDAAAAQGALRTHMASLRAKAALQAWE